MSELPVGPLDPLPILPFWILPLLALAVGLALAALLFRRLRRPPDDEPELPRPLPLGATPRSDFASRLASLGRSVHSEKDYRRGCHSLAALARQRLATVTGLPAIRMTVSELVESLGDPSLTRFLQELRGVRYGRSEPRKKDFDRLLLLAERNLGEEEGIRRRDGG